jgi:ribonuclease D
LDTPDCDLPAFERGPRYRPDPALDARVERLKLWRTEYAKRIGLPPGLFAPNATIEAIGRARPTTPDELHSIPAIRRWQVRTFGGELLAELQRVG